MQWALLGVAAFVVMSLGGLAVVRAFLIRLPATYFSEPNQRGPWADAHPALRWTGLILKNITGAALIVLGIIMALPGVPGPGFLTILIGVMLMDFPGKRRLERSIVARPAVLAAVNRLRERHGREPFVLDEPPAI